MRFPKQASHRWRSTYGGLKGNEMKRLKELEREKAQLRQLVADQALEVRALKGIAEGNV